MTENEKPKRKVNCYECQHLRWLPRMSFASCLHPQAGGVSAASILEIVSDELEVYSPEARNFDWPIDFVPSRVIQCKGFTRKALPIGVVGKPRYSCPRIME